MIKRVFILGDHVQGLGVIRICKRLGLKTVLFNDYALSIAKFSKNLDIFVRYYDHKELIKQLVKRRCSLDTLIIPTNDTLVKLISDNRDVLAGYHINLPSHETTMLCFDKVKTYKKAHELGIPYPKSYYPETMDELLYIATQIRYPVIIKPAVMSTFLKKTGKKALLCNNGEELISNYEVGIKAVPSSEIIIQEFLPGGPKNLYSYGSFFANGKSWCSFVANRSRQRPFTFGRATTYAVSVVNKEIDDLATKLLEEIDYFGVSETEFMYDEITGEYKLLEINPRTWKWHSMANVVNVSPIESLIKYLNNERSLVEVHNKIEGLAWIERVIDTYIVFKELMKGKKSRISLKEYLTSLSKKKEYAVWDLKDPLPAIMYLILTPYLKYKRG